MSAEEPLPKNRGSGIIVNVRRMEVSCLESPFVLLNINFSGMCDNQCLDCHSQALWEVLETDKISIEVILDTMEKSYGAGIIDGICIMGTDYDQKGQPVQIICEKAKEMGMISVVFTGYDSLEEAVIIYGHSDWFVVGSYVSGEWHENKKFYKREKGSYRETSMDEYFNR